MLREGKFEARNPGNHIKSKVKFKILFIFMPPPAIRKTANNDSISRPNSRPKLPFPGNGKGNYKMPQEGKFDACIPGSHGKREFPLTPGACSHVSASAHICMAIPVDNRPSLNKNPVDSCPNLKLLGNFTRSLA